MKPQKYAARRLTKENQTISTITSDRDGDGGGGGGGNGGARHTPANNAVQQPQPPMYDRDRLTQVKTYTDHGNGYGQRSGGTTTHYSKVRNHLAKLFMPNLLFKQSFIVCKFTCCLLFLTH